MAERDYYHARHHRRRRQRLVLVGFITLLVGATLAYVHTCSQRIKVPDVYNPKDVDRFLKQNLNLVPKELRGKLKQKLKENPNFLKERFGGWGR